jgi:tripartite-type tricarboxylate transporter receptor subunit TctC
MNRRKGLAAALAMLLGISAGAACAQDTQGWPARPIRFVVPFPPGGATDVLARSIGRKLAQALGQQVVVDNRGGGGGTIGAALVAKAPADGYTMLFANTNIAINPTLYKSLPYEPETAFAPVVQMTQVPVLYVVPADLPVRTLPELTALAKQKPGSLNYASAGNGSFPHLAVELYKHQAGASITHIPYAGLAPAMAALLARDVQLVAVDILTAMPHIRSGAIRALAVSTSERAPMLPDIPTVAETGLQGFAATGWHGIMVPAGTPTPIVQRLNAEVNKALREPDLRDLLVQQGFILSAGTPQQFGDFVKADTLRWKAAVTASGARVD